MGQWGVGSPQTRPACSSLSLLLCPSLEGRGRGGGFLGLQGDLVCADTASQSFGNLSWYWTTG